MTTRISGVLVWSKVDECTCEGMWTKAHATLEENDKMTPRVGGWPGPMRRRTS